MSGAGLSERHLIGKREEVDGCLVNAQQGWILVGGDISFVVKHLAEGGLHAVFSSLVTETNGDDVLVGAGDRIGKRIVGNRAVVILITCASDPIFSELPIAANACGESVFPCLT